MFFNKVEKKIICTNDGFYEIKDDSIIKFVILHRKQFIFENFLDSYTLLVDNTYIKKIGNVDFIPFESYELQLSIFSFDIPESNNKFVLEYINNRVSDFYFQTKEQRIPATLAHNIGYPANERQGLLLQCSRSFP